MRDDHPLSALHDLPGPSDKYYRWLVESVLVEGKTTLWCANHIGAEHWMVLRDFNKAVWGEVEEIE